MPNKKLFVFVMILLATSAIGQQIKSEQRTRFLQMFARAYFAGRTGHLLIVPREGDIITRPEPEYRYMHASPWSYDVSIPMMFVGPAVKNGIYLNSVAQQDVAPTLATALGVRMPASATGRVLPILKTGFVRPKAIMLIVLDGMRRDYFDRYADILPTLTGLRKRGAWFSKAQINFLPTNTAVGHSTISTGTDPSIHGITAVSVFDRIHGTRKGLFEGMQSQNLMALTLADVWQLSTSGKAVIIAQGSIDRAATPLAGHGACQLNGAPVAMASYDQQTGNWNTNPDCFNLPVYLKDRNAKTLWQDNAEWLGHKIDSPGAIRYTALFPTFEADAIVSLIQNEPIGADDTADLILLNFKGADFVGHQYGPDSNELRLTLAAMDQQIARILATLEAKVGKDYVLAVTADHGMAAEPSSPERRHFAPSIIDALHQKFDPEAKKLITSYEPENSQIFVDEERLSQLGLTLRELARFLESQPGIFAVFTVDDVREAAKAR